MARVVCDQLSTQFRQPVVVENRAGAGTAIAAAFVAKSDPDGYTVLVNSSAHTISPLLQPNPTFDPGRDFSAVIPFGNSPNVLVVSPSRGFKTVGDLLAAARAKPGSLNFASAGVGSGVHMSAERFLASAGIVAVHVPFKGSPEAISELMAGRVDFYFSPVGLVAAHIREGKLLALAVNSPKRAVILPEVPTLAEAGVADAEYPLWYGLFVPARTPRHVVETLHRNIKSPQDTERGGQACDAWLGTDGHDPGEVRCACRSRDSHQRGHHQRGRNQISQKFTAAFVTGTDRSNGD